MGDIDLITPSTLTELKMLGLSFVLSLMIGIERHVHQKSAGIRTHVLVSIGSTTFTLVSAYGFAGVVGQDVTLDPSRIAAQVVSGIGFLGAGVIFMRRDAVRGLTTAAAVWVSAAVGMACGAGMPILAIAATLAHLSALLLVTPLARRLPVRRPPEAVLDVCYRDGQGVLRALLATSAELGYEVSVRSTEVDHVDGQQLVRATMQFTPGRDTASLIETLGERVGVVSVRDTQDDDR